MAHGFVRVVGYGVCLLPRAPFAVRALDGSLEVVVADDAGDFTTSVDAATEQREHVYGDVFGGPAIDHWRLEVGGVYTARWPEDLRLLSWPEPNQPPFFMLGDDQGSLLYVQGPYEPGRAPKLATMRGAGQREVGRGGDGERLWLDLAYDHRGTPWRQRHVVAPLGNQVMAVVTAQMPLAQQTRIAAFAAEFASSIAPAMR